MGQCPGRSVQNCPCSPHFLLQPCKTEAGRGIGGATVLSDKCLSMTGGPYCHANAWCSSPLTKGKMLPVFFSFVFLWSGPCPLPLFGRVLFFLGSVCAITFRARTFFCFLSVALCFWWGFAYVFCVFSCCEFAPEAPLKKPLHVRSCSFWFVLLVLGFGLTTFLLFFSLSCLFFTEEGKTRSNRTPHPPPHVLFGYFLFFFCPCRTCLFACSGRAALLFLRFFGVPFWAPRVFWILSGLL